MTRSILIIPAYEPSVELTGIINGLANDYSIIIVDDGSNSDLSKFVFKEIKSFSNVHILRHDHNLGKGAALKTAMTYVSEKMEFDYVVTVDADGQHLVSDVLRVLNFASNSDECSLILGERNFNQNTPIKSRLGNNITALIFKYLHNYDLKDTQTGLRAIHKSLVPDLVKLKSNKYDFETDVLLFAIKNNKPIQCLDIETVYIDENKNSHFKPVTDSVLIYRSIFAFASIGLLSFAIDYFIFVILYTVIDMLFPSVVVARILSGIFNFSLNYKIFIGYKSNCKTYLFSYTFLFLCILIMSYITTAILVVFNISALIAKPLTDFLLFFVSFYFQRIVFKK